MGNGGFDIFAADMTRPRHHRRCRLHGHRRHRDRNDYVPKAVGTYVFKLGTGFDKIWVTNATSDTTISNVISFFGITEANQTADDLRKITLDYTGAAVGVTVDLSAGTASNTGPQFTGNEYHWPNLGRPLGRRRRHRYRPQRHVHRRQHAEQADRRQG